MNRPLPKKQSDFSTQKMKTSTTTSTYAIPLILTGFFAIWFASGIWSEPSFVDEWAYISQAYFTDLYLNGRTDDVAWIEYPAYDLPPLPKYVIGGALKLAGLPSPSHEMMVRWYRNTSTKTGTDAMLTVARWPSVGFGALGCLAIYAIGAQVGGRRLGLLSACFLALNPLYRLHARRAMSDVPAEALILTTLALTLWLWEKRRSKAYPIITLGMSIIIGIPGGLAVLAKLNGALALMTIGLWSLWDLGASLGLRVRESNSALPNGPGLGSIPANSTRGGLTSVGLALLAGLVGFATFTALNPFLTAKPKGNIPSFLNAIAQQDIVGRAWAIASHRAEVSSGAALMFPHNALMTIDQKVAAVAVQGYGRFGPLGPGHTDSTKRFDLAQDWGTIVWLPLVLAGLGLQLSRGRVQRLKGEPDTSVLLVLMVGLAAVVVTSFIPLAWDRYYLSIQPGAAILGATTIDALIGWVIGRRSS